jgi:surface protein
MIVDAMFGEIETTGTLTTNCKTSAFAVNIPSTWKLNIDNYILARYYVFEESERPDYSDRLSIESFSIPLEHNAIVSSAALSGEDVPAYIQKLVVDGSNVGTNNTLTTGEHEVKIYLKDDVATLFSLFTGVTSLTHVDFSRFDSSIITGEYADYGMMATFAGAMNLSSINFSGLDTSAFKQFVMSFVDTSLTTLDLSSLDLSNVEAAVYMISLNNLLTSVDFGTNTFSNCQAFDCFMYGNMALESLDISNFDMSSVSSCTNMLIYNIALKSAKLFSWTPAQDIGGCLMGMFYGCSSLPEVDLSGCDFSNITSTTAFDAMFGDCSNLSKVTVFSSYNGIAHEQMFENVATTGTLITDNTSNTFALSAPSTWSVITSYIDIQLNNTSNTQVFSSTAYSNLRSYIAGMTVDGQDVNISNYPEIPATSSIATYSARASYPVIRVYFKDTINTINLYRLFYNQSNISSVDMSHFKLLNIKNMQEMFYNASNLTNINITGLNTCYATLGSHMFRSCKNLRNIEGVTNLDMSSITTLNAAFYECAALTEVDLSGWTTSKALTDMGHMFNGCTTLKTVVLPEITDASVTTIGSIFNNCKALESVDLSPVNLEAVTDATNVFNACSNLTEVTVNTTVSSATVTSMFTGVASSGTLNASNNSNIFVDNVPSGWKVEVPSYMTIEIKSGASSLFNSSGYSNISKYIKKITVNDTNVTISNSPNLPNDINTIVIHFKNFDQSVSLSRLFYDNTYITSIDLSEFNASNVTKMSSMFYGCSSLTSLDLSNLDTSKVTDMYSMFYDCSSLTSLDLDSFDFSKVTEMTFMFCGCTSLTSLTVNTDVTSVSSSSYMFYDITTSGTLYTNSANNIFAKNVPSTWTVKLPSYMTIEIKGEAGCLFFNGAGYKSIANYIKKMTVNSENVEVSRTPNLPNDTNTVVVYFDEFNEDIILWNLFCDNKYITSVDLSNFDASKVVNMGYMFTSCTSLASLNLSNLDTSNVTDMSFMFYTCSELTSLDLSSFDFNKVTGISSIFRKCTSLTSLTVNTDITSVSSSSKIFDGVTTSGTLYTNSSDNIFAKNVPSTWTVKLSNYITLEIKSGASYIFYSSAYSNISSYIKKMIVNDEEVEISNTPSLPNDSNTVVVYFNKFKEDVSLRYLFYKGTSITNIDLSNFNTSNVTDMSYMFYYCSSLTSLNLSNLDTSNVTNMYSMFSGCSKLTSLDVSSFNTSKVTNMGYMFNSCSLLTSLDVSSFNTSKVTNMGYMFGSCSLLTLFDLSKFDTSKVIDMGAMFAHCKLLTSLNLSNFDTSNTTEMQSLFYNCSSLTSLDLSNFNFSKVVNIYYIFYNCTSLTSLTVNTNVTSMSSSSNMFGNITTTGKLYTNSSTNIFAVNKPSTWSISLI